MRILIWLNLICCCLCGCSPINSVAPFDEQQAAILVQSWHVNRIT